MDLKASTRTNQAEDYKLERDPDGEETDIIVCRKIMGYRAQVDS